MIAATIGVAVVALSTGCQTQKPSTPAPAASGIASSTAPSTAAAKWSGTVYAFRTGQDNHVDVYALDGASRKLIASTPPGADSCAPISVSVSPDGKMIAWVNTGRERLDGDLFLGTLGGAPAKKVAAHIVCGGTGPTWAPDSQSMQVTQRTGDKLQNGRIDAATGAFTAAEFPGRVWSPSGALVAYSDAKHTSITVAKADGTIVRTVGYQPDWADCVGWLPQTLSEDGHYLSVGHAACDPSRMLSVEKIVDTTTGKEIPLPVAKIERAYFRTDGSMIVISENAGYVVRDGVIVAHQELASDGLTILGLAA